MAVVAMQGANQHILSSLGFSILDKDRPGESNQRPSDNNTLAPPLSPRRHIISTKLFFLIVDDYVYLLNVLN